MLSDRIRANRKPKILATHLRNESASMYPETPHHATARRNLPAHWCSRAGSARHACSSCAYRSINFFVPRPGKLTDTRRSSSRSEEHTSELQSPCNLVCRLLLEKKKLQR